jgi:proline racemase
VAEQKKRDADVDNWQNGDGQAVHERQKRLKKAAQEKWRLGDPPIPPNDEFARLAREAADKEKAAEGKVAGRDTRSTRLPPSTGGSAASLAALNAQLRKNKK